VATKVRTLVFSLLPSLALLGALELGSRLAWNHIIAFRMSYEHRIEYEGEPAIFEKKVVAGVEYHYTRDFPTRYYRDDDDLAGTSIRAVKTERTFRVFSYGGSATAGSPFGNWASFSHNLGKSLDAIKRDDTSVEMVNFGVSGFGSTRVRRLVERTVEYRPDVIIIYSGHNELCDSLGTLQAAAQPRSGTRAWITSVARASRFVQLVRFAIRSRPERPREPFSQPGCVYDVRLAPEQIELLTAIYRNNMTAIAALARERSIAVLFLSQFSNTMHRPEVPSAPDQGGLPRETGLGRCYDAHQGQVCEQQLRSLLDEDPDNATGRFFLGLSKVRAGEFADAYDDLMHAIENEPLPRRFRPSYRSVLMDLDEPASGSHFVDVEKEVRRTLPDGIIDGRLVMDIMHPNVTGYRLITRVLLDKFFVAERFRPDLFDYNRNVPEQALTDDWNARGQLRACDISRNGGSRQGTSMQRDEKPGFGSSTIRMVS
jgi:lysophospholipase L1-like esterase